MQNFNHCINKQFQTQRRQLWHILQKKDPFWLLVTTTLRNLSANFIKYIYQKGVLFIPSENVITLALSM